MKPNKAATFESLLELMENAEYAYSEENRDNNESASVPMFHYFVADAIIGNKHIPVKIQVRDIVSGYNTQSRYYTHNLLKNIAGSDSPVAGTQSTNIDSNAYAPADNNISHPAESRQEDNTDLQRRWRRSFLPEANFLTR